MGWTGKLPSELKGGLKFYGIPRALVFVFSIMVLGASMNSSKAQDVWFPWLDHLSQIQSQWTTTQGEAFSVWNNITRFQDFKEYERQMNEILSLVDSMEKQRVIDKTKYAQTYQTFFEISDEYVFAMRHTISQLELVLGKLKEKSENLESYSLREYQRDLNQYDKLLTAYRAIGKRMNDTFKKAQSDN